MSQGNDRTTAADWFATPADFLQACADAHSMAESESAQEFAGEMVLKAKQYGLRAFLSERQLRWLCQLADIVQPQRIVQPTEPGPAPVDDDPPF